MIYVKHRLGRFVLELKSKSMEKEFLLGYSYGKPIYYTGKEILDGNDWFSVSPCIADIEYDDYKNSSDFVALFDILRHKDGCTKQILLFLKFDFWNSDVTDQDLIDLEKKLSNQRTRRILNE